jgi:hemolysin activation/secretion protein
VHYLSLPQWRQTTLTPYVFYDAGEVWDLYPNAPEEISGASAGPGISILCACGLTGSFYIAEPLTKPINTPLYTNNRKAPRFAFQLSYKFN